MNQIINRLVVIIVLIACVSWAWHLRCQSSAEIAALNSKVTELEKVVLMNDQLLYIALLGVFDLARMEQSEVDILEKYFSKRKPFWGDNSLE